MKYLLRALAWWYNNRGEIKYELAEEFLDRLDGEILDELLFYDDRGGLGRFLERYRDREVAEYEQMIDDAEWNRGCGL